MAEAAVERLKLDIVESASERAVAGRADPDPVRLTPEEARKIPGIGILASAGNPFEAVEQAVLEEAALRFRFRRSGGFRIEIVGEKSRILRGIESRLDREALGRGGRGEGRRHAESACISESRSRHPSPRGGGS
jgi:hypothetical protein